MRNGSRLRVGMGSALLALTTLCPISYAEEAVTTGQGGWIGVRVQPLTDALRSEWDYQAAGVLVTAVAPGSPAQLAGVARGDVLVLLGPISLRDVGDLAKAESRIVPGEPVSLIVAKESGRLIRISTIEPAEPPAAPADEAAPATAPEALPAPPAGKAIRPATVGPDEEESAPAAVADLQAVEPPAETPAESPEDVAKAETPSESPAPEVAKAEHAGGVGLGVRGEALGADLASALAVPSSRGFIVLEVGKSSPADRAGIRPGDVIVRAGDLPIDDAESLGRAIGAASGSIALRVQRQKAERRIDVPLEDPPDPASAAREGEVASRDRIILGLRDELKTLRRENQRLRAQLEAVASQ